MEISRAKAIRLLSASEFKLYEASRRGRVKDHGALRLSKLIESARKQRDKQQTLAQKQRAKSASPRGAKAAESTQLKIQIFEDVLSRFEKALARTLAEAERGARKRAAGKASKKPAAKKSAAKKAAKKAVKRGFPAKKAASKRGQKVAAKKVARASEKKKAVRVQAHAERAPKGAAARRKGQISADRAHLAHAASRGRRNQAKRDKKR